MGVFTFFLPCGFTLTVQGLALISGNPFYGTLITSFFVLGTLPSLLLIGFSGAKLSQNPQWSQRFLKIAGVMVLFFALFNINSQMNVLGLGSANKSEKQQATEEGLAPIIDGKQLIRMTASSRGYAPSYFKVKAGIPVRWEITDGGTSGCTNAVISRKLFEGDIKLSPGQTSVKEFIPKTPGKYKFSCWMGMISGTIEVI